MEIIVGLILVAAAGYRAWRLPNHWRWLLVLAVPLAAGSLALAHALYWMSRTDCGALYSPDIGCANAGGSWDVVVGLGAGGSTVVVSIGIVGYSSRHSKVAANTRPL